MALRLIDPLGLDAEDDECGCSYEGSSPKVGEAAPQPNKSYKEADYTSSKAATGKPTANPAKWGIGFNKALVARNSGPAVAAAEPDTLRTSTGSAEIDELRDAIDARSQLAADYANGNAEAYCPECTGTALDPVTGPNGSNATAAYQMADAAATTRVGMAAASIEMEVVGGIEMGMAAESASFAKAEVGTAKGFGKARTNGELVKDVATAAESKVGGVGAAAGSKKHAYAKKLLDRYQKMFGSRGLETEVSYVGGVPKGYGTKGSVRLDVWDKNARVVYDYKFTTNPGKGLTTSQISKIVKEGPKSIAQILEVNP